MTEHDDRVARLGLPTTPAAARAVLDFPVAAMGFTRRVAGLNPEAAHVAQLHSLISLARSLCPETRGGDPAALQEITRQTFAVPFARQFPAADAPVRGQ